jgi:WD40 repeat protein
MKLVNVFLIFGFFLAACRPAAVAPSPKPVGMAPTSGTFKQKLGEPVSLTGIGCAPTRLAWSPDGALLASICGGFERQDYDVHVWNRDGSQAGKWKGHTQPLTDLSWSPNGATLATGALDGTIRLWSRTGDLQKTWETGAGRVFAVAWSPDGMTLSSGSIMSFLNPTVQLWDMQGELHRKLSTSFSGGKFYNLAWSPDGKFLLGGATDYKLWRSDGALVFWLKSCEQCTPAWGMAWSPQGDRWAVGDESGYVEIYSLQGDKLAALQDQQSVNSLAWSPDGRELAGARTLWSAGGQILNALGGWTNNRVNYVAWSPDGSRLALGGSDGVIYLYAADGSLVQKLGQATGEVNALAWSPDGNILAAAITDKTIVFWH